MTVSVYSRYQCVHVCIFAELYLTLCDPMDRSLTGSSVHGISQARILQWIALPFSRGIFPTQGLKLGLLPCKKVLYHLSQQGIQDTQEILSNEWEKTQKTFRQTPGVEVPDPICRDKGNSMTTCPTRTPTFSSMVMVFTGSFLGTYSGLINGFPVLILPWVRIIFLNRKVFLASSFSFWLPVFSFPSVFDSPVYCVPVFSRMASEQGNAMGKPVGKFWCGKSVHKRGRAFWTANGLWIGCTRWWVTRWLAQIQLWTPSLLNSERWRIDAFELWCWRRLLRVPWTARRSNQSILKEISPEYSLEWLMPKLKVQFLATCFEELTLWKRPWCWERLKAGGEEDDRGRDGWMASLTQQTWLWVCSRSWRWTGRPGVLQFMVWQRVGYDWATELNWTV